MIYLDNAATSWPKPPAVVQAVSNAVAECFGNPGRTDHRSSFEAAEIILGCREKLAKLFRVSDPLRICFTSNTTSALNLALKGLLAPGDHVICTSLEHNSVWRPLMRLEQLGTEVSIVQASADGTISLEDIAAQIRANTRLIASIHASNVTGAILPVAEIGRIAHQHDALFLIDAAQTAGSIPIDVEEMQCDLLAFPGHKGLLGPQGTGGLYIREGLTLTPLMEGGTGSDSSNPYQPEFEPDRYEAGTQNLPGLAGLSAGLSYLLHRCVKDVSEWEHVLTQRLLEGLAEIKSVTLYGPPLGRRRSAVVSFNIKGKDAARVAEELATEFDIACRSGLHCALLAHCTQGTAKSGTVRFSPGPFTGIGDVDQAVKAVREIASH